MAVVVTRTDGTEKTYEQATVFERDGYGDYVFKNDRGLVVGSLRRELVEGTEVQ